MVTGPPLLNPSTSVEARPNQVLSMLKDAARIPIVPMVLLGFSILSGIKALDCSALQAPVDIAVQSAFVVGKETYLVTPSQALEPQSVKISQALYSKTYRLLASKA